MSEWQEFLIEDLADFCNAKRVPLSSMQRQQLQGSYPYYGASGIVDYVNDYIFEGSHVLISEDGENFVRLHISDVYKADLLEKLGN